MDGDDTAIKGSMYPRSDEYRTNSMSLYLTLSSADELPHGSEMMIELTLTILNQTHGPHRKASGRCVFASEDSWGWSNFIALDTLKDLSRGYLVGSSCIVKANIIIIGSSNDGWPIGLMKKQCL